MSLERVTNLLRKRTQKRRTFQKVMSHRLKPPILALRPLQIPQRPLRRPCSTRQIHTYGWRLPAVRRKSAGSHIVLRLHRDSIGPNRVKRRLHLPKSTQISRGRHSHQERLSSIPDRTRQPALDPGVPGLTELAADQAEDTSMIPGRQGRYCSLDRVPYQNLRDHLSILSLTAWAKVKMIRNRTLHFHFNQKPSRSHTISLWSK